MGPPKFVAFPPDAYLDAREPGWLAAEQAGLVRYGAVTTATGQSLIAVAEEAREIIAAVQRQIRRREISS